MRIAWAFALGWGLAPVVAAAEPGPGEADFFESRVRPVLADHCFGCHGPEKQKAGLRLDSRAALLKGSESGPVVVPGSPDDSPLIEAVRHAGPVKMPPKKRLPPRAVADLAHWVKAGAIWPESDRSGTAGRDADRRRRHWAFQPIGDPPPPAVRRADWPRTSIDPFILAKLEAKGLAPSPTADKRTLVRRATFDLTGLPPTPEEVAAFESDGSADAFAKVVDRLLASPHYGERWGRHWLDVARYADTKGYVFFQDANFPWSYTYRDYVIRAFNDDLPYDRFLVEQLAADRLPLGPDKRPLTALGFLTLGGRFMNNAQDVLDDRIDVTTRGLLGLTVTCARCHDHKFDPIPTRDYYALYGVFANSIEPDVPPLFQDPPRTKEYAAFEAELRSKERKTTEFVALKHAELVDGARKRAAEYLLAAQAALGQPTTEDFMLIADGADLNPAMIVRWRTFLERTRKRRHPVFAPWHALASLSESDFPAGAAKLVEEWSRNPGRLNPVVVQALANCPPRTLAEAARTYSKILNSVEPLSSDSARRAGLNGTPPPPLPVLPLEELRQVFHGPDAPPDVPLDPFGDLTLLPDRASQAKLQELRKAVETWRATGPGAPPRAMALEDAPTPVEPRVFVRGNANNLGEPVPRQFLEALAGKDRKPFRDGSGRLELARAIADRKNPLTARVLVNRVWLHHFGRALVGTPSDFGLRSDPPSHPELLDHLATSFMEGGWSIKALHRRIMLSATYRQASIDRDECRRIDPENALLWKANRRRLDFESTRDALLAVSGRLDRKIGGPSISGMPAITRRTLYGVIDRLNLPGLYRTFDFPDPNATSPKRESTTVAPQALFLMNHPFVIESAKAVLKRPEVAAETDVGKRVERLHRLIYQRNPTSPELSLARDYLMMNKGAPADWERYAQALLMANEFVFVD